MTARRKANRGPQAGPENRRALVAAAREIFAVEGFAAPLSAVAKKAGVGQGSLYRHFPDRTALAVAVFEENLTDLEALAAADGSLDALLAAVTDQAMVSAAFIDMITADPHDQRVIHLGERLSALAAAVISHERAAERWADGAGVEDLILAITMLATLLAHTDPADRPDVARRAWRLLHAAFAP